MSVAPGFVAYVHADAASSMIDATLASLGLSGAGRIALENGWLTLWPGRDQVGGDPDGPSFLAVIDGTGGAPKLSVPPSIADISGIPAALRGHVAQHRSYLWLDRGRIGVWTDHTGLSRLHAACFEHCTVLSDRTDPLAALAPGVDIGMVASFLANRWMLLDRTLDVHVHSIPVASIGTVTPLGITAAPYWRFRPGSEPVGDEAALEAELWSRIRSSVAAHAGGRPVLLPLSGGYDSSMLLGTLHAIGLPVTAFSFAEGEPRAGSDAAVAHIQAQTLGVPHRLYRMDGAGTVELLEANFANGLQSRALCYELDVYQQAAADAPDGAVFMFGEQGFGMGGFRLDSDAGLLGAAAMRDPAILDGLADALGDERVDSLQQALAAVYRDVLATLPALPARDDLKDWLYFTNLFRSDTGPLRVHTAAPHLPIAKPFLDLSVLDFVKHLGVGHRMHKSLFRQVGTRRLPQVFATGRARRTQAVPDLTVMLRRDRAAIGRLIETLGADIPALGPADGLVRLQQDAGEPVPAGLRALALAGAGDVYRVLLQRGLLPRPVVLSLRRRLLNRHGWRPSREAMFLRTLHLAMILGRRPAAVSAGLRPVGGTFRAESGQRGPRAAA